MEFVENDIVYHLEQGLNRAIVWKVKSSETEITIPKVVKGKYTVKEIAHHAFYQNRDIEKVFLPDSISLIGESAFEGCVVLKEVQCINPVAPIIILKRAFCMCYNLQNIYISGKVVINEDAVFQDCYNLKDLPCSISGLIRQYTFYRCKKLESIRFEDIRLLPRSFNNVPELKTLIIAGKLQAAKLTIKKLTKYEIHCPNDSPLVDLAYSGHKIIIL